MSRLSEYSKFDHLVVDDDDDDDDKYKNHNKNDDKRSMNNNTTGTTTGLGAAAASCTRTSATSTINNNGIERYRVSTSKRGSRAGYNRNTKRTVFIFEYNNQPIYEWEQGLYDVIIAVPTPSTIPTIKASDINCIIMPTCIQIGLKQSRTYFIDECTYEKIDVHESTWTLEEEDDDDEVSDQDDSDNNDKQVSGATKKTSIKRNVIVLYLQKVAKGLVWPYVLRRSNIDHSDPNAGAENDNNGKARLNVVQMDIVTQEILKERWQEENPCMDFSEATFNGSVPNPRTFMGGVRYNT